MAQVGNGSLSKRAFAELYPKAVGGQGLKNSLQMGEVSSQRRTVHKYIIKKDQNELTQIWLKYGVHQSLKGGWSIREAERHNQEFIVALVCAKGCFRNVVRVHSNLMVA